MVLVCPAPIDGAVSCTVNCLVSFELSRTWGLQSPLQENPLPLTVMLIGVGPWFVLVTLNVIPVRPPDGRSRDCTFWICTSGSSARAGEDATASTPPTSA